MGLDKKTFRQILLLITFAVLLTAALIKFSDIMEVVRYVTGVLVPVVVGLCMSFIINVMLSLIENKLFAPLNRRGGIWTKFRRPVCLILSISVLFGIIAGLFVMIIPEISRTVELITTSLPTYAEKISTWADGILSYFNMSLDEIINIDINWATVGTEIANFLKTQSKNVFDTTFGITSAIFGGVTNFIIAFVISIYVLLSKEKLGRSTDRVMRAYLPSKLNDGIIHISKVSYRIFAKFVTGQFTEAIILGVLCFIGMSIFRFPYASMISALIGFTALIPVVGAFVGVFIGAFLILMINPMQAFWFIVFILILQQIENNVIYPRVVGKSVGLPGIWVLIAVTLGGSMFGVTGMLIGVPVTSVIYSLVTEAISKRLGDPPDDDVDDGSSPRDFSRAGDRLLIRLKQLPSKFRRGSFKK